MGLTDDENVTPRTDAEAGEAVFTVSGCAADVVNADFARQLERELRAKVLAYEGANGVANGAMTALEQCRRDQELVAARLLRDEIKRLDYPKSMFPQEAEKISRKQSAFEIAARFLEGETV